MNKEWKKKWIEALRSGKYQQGKRMLRHRETNNFCCWGVLCDIVDPAGWREPVMNGDGYGYLNPSNTGMPPEVVYEKCGLVYNPDTGLLQSDTIADELASMNDNGKSFKEIADKIEENL